MRLTKGQLFLGVAPKIIVDCARQLWLLQRGFTLDEFCRSLGAPVDEARPVLEAMIREGYVEDRIAATEQYEPTKQLSRLKSATIGPGLTRQQASALLQKVIAQAVHINANPEHYCVTVRTLAVFGSYLSDAAVLGDLDVGYEIELIPSGECRQKAVQAFRAGRKGSDEKARSALKCHNRHVSLHTMTELKRLGTPFLRVFADGEPTRTADGVVLKSRRS
jgi:hypothetical protein